MALEAGTKLGHYEVVSSLGAGGMGEVYRAKDTKLGREVAIKVLPEGFSDEPERMARFEREAKVLASLNHNNIATLHGFETDGEKQFLVMELVEGETLADRIKRGAIPVDEALPLFLQIAEGLEAAHEKGVIHRDLKPANIKVTDDGQVKILDFGLAKAMVGDEASTDTDSALSPTLTHDFTHRGVILGTAAYMSPEQARGKPIDSRSDVFAFGGLLYELLVGRVAFGGETATDIIASVVKETPDWDAFPNDVPRSVRRLVERCLRKPPFERLQHMGDARIVLNDAIRSPDDAAMGPAANPRPQSIVRRPAIAAVGLLLLGALLSWTAMRVLGDAAGGPEPTWHLGFEVGVLLHGVAVSPDGRDIFYISQASGDVRRLYHRPANRPEAQEVLGTEGAQRIAFSPDGERLAIMTGGRDIKMLDVNDRRVRDVGGLDDGQASGVAWVSNDTLVLGAGTAGLWQVSATGGTPRRIAAAGEDERLAFPGPLPGGRKVVASRLTPTVGGFFITTEIVVVDLESGEVTPLDVEGTYPRYVDTGHIVFARTYGQSGGGARLAGTLWAVPFDPDELAITGDPVPTPIHPAVSSAISSNGVAYLDISAGGILTYVPEAPLPSLSLVWVDQAGNEEPASQHRGAYRTPSLSFDGSRVAYRVQEPDGRYQVWIHDLRTDEPAQLTSGERFFMPKWSGSRDSDEFVYYTGRPGNGEPSGFFRERADFSGEQEQLASQEVISFTELMDIAPSGDFALVGVQVDGPRDIWLIPFDGDRQPRPYLQGDAFYGHGRLSPDGEWLAFTIGRPGESGVYVQGFPEGDRVRVSRGNGEYPLWSPAGDEIYFRSGDGWMMSAPVQTQPLLSVGEPVGLFEMTGYERGGGTHQWEIGPDGRFLMLKEHETLPPLSRVHVVLNWFEELKRLVPTD